MSEPAGPDQDLDDQGVDWSLNAYEEEFSEDAVHPVGKEDSTKMPPDEGDAAGPYGNEGSLEGRKERFAINSTACPRSWRTSRSAPPSAAISA